MTITNAASVASNGNMSVDHILYSKEHHIGRTWICQITETADSGRQRFWRAERTVGNLNYYDDAAKTEVLEEAFCKYLADVLVAPDE